MQGSDGVFLSGLHHEEESLPAFVHNYSTQSHKPRLVDTKGGIQAIRVEQKMETPVIYFYTDKPQRVRVGVSFTRGIISQWFPSLQSHLADAAYGLVSTDTVDMSKVRRSRVWWDIDVIPASAGAPPEVPKVPADDIWSFAREVRAAWVRTRGDKPEAERYLFYRGLGAYRIPLHVEAAAGGALLSNKTGSEIPFAVAMEVNPGGARFEVLGAVADSARSYDLSRLPLRATGAVVEELKVELLAALVAAGLFEDEARGMVRTWARSWFKTEGSRVIYLVPRAVTDGLLPLTVQPAPEKVVRVLVGRLEYITPQVEAEVEAAVRAADDKRLARLGRFLEPHMRRILAVTRDERVQKSIRATLAKLQ